jgi:preprotein translocase subunit SecY
VGRAVRVLPVAARALTNDSSTERRLADMSVLMKAITSLAAAVAAVVAMASLAGTLADVLGGVALLAAILVLMRAIMDFAAEPAEGRQRSGRQR